MPVASNCNAWEDPGAWLMFLDAHTTGRTLQSDGQLVDTWQCAGDFQGGACGGAGCAGCAAACADRLQPGQLQPGGLLPEPAQPPHGGPATFRHHPPLIAQQPRQKYATAHTADDKQLHAALEGDVRGCICQTRRISPPMVLLGSHFIALVPICGS